MTIPRKIHYCWYGGKPLTPLAQACVESWERKAGEFEIVRWDESNTPINDHPYMRIAYKQGLWAFVADYARLQALIEHGGIYLDTDMEVVKPLGKFLEHTHVVGNESDGQISAGIIGAHPNSAFLKACLEWMDRDASAGSPSFTSIPKIMQQVYDAGDFDVTIYPPRFFYPYNPYDPDQPVKQLLYSDITEETYAIHHWSASWVKPRTWTQYAKSVLKYAYRNLPKR